MLGCKYPRSFKKNHFIEFIKTITTIMFSFVNKVYFFLYFKLISLTKKAEIINNFHSKKVLVLAPHIDDDVIGCGGTLYRFSQAGSFIKTIYLTDGSKSSKHLTKKSLVEKRKEEARQAASLLGVNSIIFFDFSDRELSLFTNEMIGKLKDVIDSYQPDIIFAPFILDKHPDHQTIAYCLPQVLDDFNKDCYLYDIIYPLSHHFIDIYSEVDIEIKRKAYAIFKSQPTNFNNILKFESFRRNLIKTNAKCIEVFHLYNKEKYNELLSAIGDNLGFKMTGINKLTSNEYYWIKAYQMKAKLERSLSLQVMEK